MPIIVQKLPDEPIVLITTKNPVLPADASNALEAFQGMLDASQEPLWDITDAREMNVSFGDLVSMMGKLSKDFSIMKHPRLGGITLIANSELLRIGANAMSQTQYGGVPTRVFTSTDEAFAHVRSQITQH